VTTATDRRLITRRMLGLGGTVVVLVVIILGWDLYQKRSICVACSDGQHCRLDMRDFVTTHSAYSLQLEAAIGRRRDLSGTLRLDPVQLTLLSESLQHANEFRKYLVAGYNSCAITAADYERDGRLFQAMDSVAREINDLASKADSGSTADHNLPALISQFGYLAKRLGGS
jgi:hypothetical protein